MGNPKGKTRVADPLFRDLDVRLALGEAVTRAIAKAPPSVMAGFRGDRLRAACHRLAMYVTDELRGDGWFERRPEMGYMHLTEALTEGFGKAGDAILRSLPDVHRCDNGCSHVCQKKALDGIGLHLGSKALAAMKKADVAIEQRPDLM